MLLSPVAERNKDALLQVLAGLLGGHSERQLFGLELGSGSGQHVVHFAQELPFVTWQPSEISNSAQDSIYAYISATKVKNVLQPVYLNVEEAWGKWAGMPRRSCDVILCINVLHFCTFNTTKPYAINGIISPESNVQLDGSLRERNPEWGLPDIDVLRQLAYKNALRLERMIEMPESNKCLLFRKIEL
ncbi:UPF0585 protein C16orf13-like B [Acipenser ruthenus]|uniref:UPF0585 protein C16orf13-like B n=1 Tax=Acipenser ruthenus TaxID=7906 RepID=A0A444UQK1_ACIRT|nr:UPF0585 protein C16orf13-like B [Acipenser ruthenus]